jgi:lipoprotein-releasing system permease protein
MYKLILSWRYLRTRWIALASIISVMLGVATMIVVNSVMEGFSREMQDRIHGILSDVVLASRGMDGMPDADWHMRKIREIVGDDIEGMTPTVAMPGMLSFRYNGNYITRQVQIVGIDPETQGQVSDFGQYLQHPDNREQMSFKLRETGYDTGGGREGLGSPRRPQMEDAGWKHRRRMAELEKFERRIGLREEADDSDASRSNDDRAASRRLPEETAGYRAPPPPVENTDAAPELRPRRNALRAPEADDPRRADWRPANSQAYRTEATPRLLGPMEPEKRSANDLSGAPAAPDPVDLTLSSPSGEPTYPIQRTSTSQPLPNNEDEEASEGEQSAADPFMARDRQEGRIEEFDPATEQHTGAVLGIALSSVRLPDGEDGLLLLPGDDVNLTIPTAGTPPKGVTDRFTVVDFYESKMSEYDSSFVFVPIEVLQDLRGMIDPATGVRMVSSIQIKLAPGVDGNVVRDKLRRAFDPHLYVVETWRDKQGPLLNAVQMEQAILNVLLFLIIAVAGFGILAIFLMIVVEKTRDIGILKSLGASGGGVMGIFLSYGLSLGVVGSGVGTLLGLMFVWNINEIADLLGRLTGRPVFDPSIYYFYQIPTIIDPWTIAWIVVGALGIAVMASVLPAMRAATLHPVEALRYE